MKLRTLATLALGTAAFFVGACGSTSNSATDAGETLTDGGGTEAAVDGSSSGVLPFKPSNIDLGGLDLSAASDVVLSGTNCPIDSESPAGPTSFLCSQDASNRVVHALLTLPDQTKISVFVMKSLRIEASTILLVNRGHLPVVLVALGTMELLGSIDVAPGTTGGAVNQAADSKGSGTGGGPAGDPGGLAGGGGSYCGLGGKGGTNTNVGGPAPTSPAPAYGTPEVVPLVAGSAGGTAIASSDGAGGGALQLVAGGSFALRAVGFVNVGGGGGAFGGQGKLGANGGGSGGALLIEASSVTIEGNLGANGGGGGQGGGNADSGEVGHPDKVAQGGHKANEGAPAGDGSFGAMLSGGDGPTSADPFVGGGGGGGGAGRIRINTTSGQAMVTGAISPPTASGCATQGLVKK